MVLAFMSGTMRVARPSRFILLDLLVRRWRLAAALDCTLPVRVTLKRFLAPEWVFIFGILFSFQRFSQKKRSRQPNSSQIALAEIAYIRIMRKESSKTALPKPTLQKYTIFHNIKIVYLVISALDFS